MTPGIVATISRRYEIQSAHRLPHVPEGHKCGRMHGHTYEIEVSLRGRLDPTLGWVIDFSGVDVVVQEFVVKVLDHRTLNDIPGLENPTSELIAWWIWQRLSAATFGDGRMLARVAIHENGRSTAAIDADV